MPNNLVAEVRIDKNGVSVTRHVKPQSARTGKALPQPKLQPASAPVPYPERESHTQALLARSMRFIDDDGLEEADFMRALNSYSDDTVRLLHKHVGDRGDQTYYAELVALIGKELHETRIREYAMFSTAVVDCEDLDEAVRYINGVRHYAPLRGIEDLTLADEETQSAARSLMSIAFQIHCMGEYGEDHPAAAYVPDPMGMGTECPVVKSPRLVSLVMDSPDRRDDIVEHIETNGFKTVKAIKEMLEGTHHATREGWL
jgi:hypothetical protein